MLKTRPGPQPSPLVSIVASWSVRSATAVDGVSGVVELVVAVVVSVRSNLSSLSSTTSLALSIQRATRLSVERPRSPQPLYACRVEHIHNSSEVATSQRSGVERSHAAGSEQGKAHWIGHRARLGRVPRPVVSSHPKSRWSRQESRSDIGHLDNYAQSRILGSSESLHGLDLDTFGRRCIAS